MANDSKQQQELKDAVEQATKATLEAVLKEVLPAVLVASKQADRQADSDAMREDAIRNMRGMEKCGECGQGVLACKGEHMMMVVFPKDEQNVPSFDGVRINGVVYRSNHGTHVIRVPASNDIAAILAAWENSEREMRNGKKVMRNSGNISPYGAYTPPQTFV